MSISTPGPLTIFTDADNTLWDTDGVFAWAQLELLSGVESALGRSAGTLDRLDFVRRIDQALAERHHLGLRYPPRLLALAVARVLVGEEVESATRAVWKNSSACGQLSDDDATAIEMRFVTDIQRQPALLPGAEVGLKRLRTSGALILVLTEGSRDRVTRTASEHGLEDYIDRIIEAPKTKRLYERVLRLTGRAGRAFMIGDQLQRDIVPAQSAGLRTIYVPSRFRPRWETAAETVVPSHCVQRFDEAVDVVLQEIRCPSEADSLHSGE